MDSSGFIQNGFIHLHNPDTHALTSMTRCNQVHPHIVGTTNGLLFCASLNSFCSNSSPHTQFPTHACVHLSTQWRTNARASYKWHTCSYAPRRTNAHRSCVHNLIVHGQYHMRCYKSQRADFGASLSELFFSDNCCRRELCVNGVSDSFRLAISTRGLLRPFASLSVQFQRCNMVQENQESRLKYWANHSSVCSFAHTTHSFVSSTCFTHALRLAALIHSLAHSRARGSVND